MNDVRTTTLQAIYDALALRGPSESGGFIRTAATEQYMDAERLRLAREVSAVLPKTATVAGAEQFIEQLVPVVLRTTRPAHET